MHPSFGDSTRGYNDALFLFICLFVCFYCLICCLLFVCLFAAVLGMCQFLGSIHSHLAQLNLLLAKQRANSSSLSSPPALEGAPPTPPPIPCWRTVLICGWGQLLGRPRGQGGGADIPPAARGAWLPRRGRTATPCVWCHSNSIIYYYHCDAFIQRGLCFL